MTYIEYDEANMDILNESIFDLNENWKYNAVFPTFDSTGIAYVRGYFEAAEYLVDNFLKMIQDFAIYPTMFLYRHYIELSLKNILYLLEGYHGISRDKPWDQHRLLVIWNAIKPLLFKCESSYTKHWREAQNCIEEFHSIDEKSLTFRYHITNTNDPSIQGHTHINILQVQKIVRVLSSYLEMISEGIYMEIELRTEYEAEMRAEYGYEMGLEHDGY